MTPDKYCIHLIYHDGKRNCYLNVKGRSQWATKQTAVKHATDIFNLKCAGSIRNDLIAIDVLRDDWELVKRFEVQS